MIESLNIELIKLVEWLHANKLSLNSDKTHFIVFTLEKKILCTTSLFTNNIPIKRVSSTKFLGIIIDEKLSWGHHIQHVKNKISKGIGILCQARTIFNYNTLLTLYYSFIFPYLLYCIEVWGSSNITLFQSVFKLQKRAVRIIVSANFKAHTDPIFQRLKILPLKKIYHFSLILLMFKYTHNLLPDIFEILFTRNFSVHQYNTRQAAQIHVPKCNTSALLKSVYFKGIIIWNYMELYNYMDCSIYSFKWHLKQYLLVNNVDV